MSDTIIEYNIAVTATEPLPPGEVQATVTIGDVSFVFNPEDGAQLESYCDPAGKFEQANVLCLVSSAPNARVYYRPDIMSDREEWVFEFGDPWNQLATNLGAYTVKIKKRDGSEVILQVPEHFHLSRWRWQSEVRPVRKTVEELIQAKLVPHYDGSVLSRYANDYNPKTYAIMRLAGIYPNQATTGERADIGIVTGWQSDYLCVGSNLQTILDQAEAGGTLNWHVRDRTGIAPMDLFVYPKATMYSSGNGADPYIKRTSCTVDGMKMAYDTGHSPAQAYLPFLLTGDPYYLEEVQFQANMDFLMDPPQSRYRKVGRYLAWSMRNTLYALAATPENVPDWLLPKSYWQDHLDGYLIWVQEKMASGDPLHLIASGGSQGSPGIPSGSYFPAWQEDFLTAMFAIAVRMGNEDWMDALIWKLDCTVNRVHAEYWPWPNPTLYNALFCYAATLAEDCSAQDITIVVDPWHKQPWPDPPFEMKLQDEITTVTGMSGNIWTLTRTKPVAHVVGHRILGPKFKSWQECAARNVAAIPEKFPTMPDDPEALYTAEPGTVTYNAYTRGALALAVGENIPAATEPYNWLHGEFLDSISTQWKVERKWAIVP